MWAVTYYAYYNSGSWYNYNIHLLLKMLYIEEKRLINRRINLLPMTRAHHGGWKMHTSKPPTMPDNASYPKKVTIKVLPIAEKYTGLLFDIEIALVIQ